jgi:hypothetical protein
MPVKRAIVEILPPISQRQHVTRQSDTAGDLQGLLRTELRTLSRHRKRSADKSAKKARDLRSPLRNRTVDLLLTVYRCAVPQPQVDRLTCVDTSTRWHSQAPEESAQSSRGREWVRRSTATSCRNTSSSAFLDAADRLNRTSQPQSRTKRR